MRVKRLQGARKRAEETLKRRASQLALINDIGGRIAAELDLDQVLDRAARLIQESFGYHHVALFALDREREELVMRAKAGNFADLFPPDHRIQLDQGMVGWAARHGERLLANDVEAEPHYVNLHPDEIPTRSELSVPIQASGETVGVLDVQSPRPNAFDENDVMVIETLADQVAVAMENARLYDAVQQELVERKQAEEALREKTHRLANRKRFISRILENIPSSLLVIDQGLQLVSANRNFLEKSRLEAQDTVGHRIGEIFPQVLLEYTQLERKVREVFRTGEPVEGEKVAY